MLKNLFLACFVLFLLLCAGACNNTKHLPKGESLYVGAKIDLNSQGLKSKQRKVLRQDLAALTRPKPNSKILGLRIKLGLYNMGGDTSKKGFLPRLFRRWGEPPVLLSSLSLEKNEAQLKNHLENTGFFRAEVRGDTVVKKRRARAIYKIEAGPQYKIEQVNFVPADTTGSDTSFLSKNILEAGKKTLLVKGAPFNLDLIKAERTRIDAFLKERGYYFFSPDFLLVQVDSTIGENKVNLFVKVKGNTPDIAFNVYKINAVFVYSNYSLNTAVIDTNKSNASYYKGYYVVDKDKMFKPLLFSQALQFSSGEVYNRTDHNLSLSRLTNLNVFKFVKNRFEEVTGVESPLMDAYYYLTPLPKKSLQFAVTGSTKSNNLTGTELTLSWRNRNTFRGGELLTVNAILGSEVQFGGQLKGYNTYTTGLHTSLSIPRFIIPFMKLDTKSGYVPRTIMMVGYDLLNKQKLYTLNSFRAEFGYAWKEDIRKEHKLNPISINYVQPADVTDVYLDSAENHPTLLKAIERQFILGSNYNYNYNQLINARPVNAFYFNGGVDVSGNIAGLIVPNSRDTNTKQIFNSDFSQYIKGEADFRYYRRIGVSMTWANRIIMGVGVPYGNSKEMPFIKQFFIGGNNSVRAFRSRSIGPGIYKDTALSEYPVDQSGDIKLELNTELRVKFTRMLEGAVFVDAGNIWLFRENPAKPGAKFSKDFIKELAVGAGAGIRFDFNIFLIRLDVAFPLRKPYLRNTEWVMNQVDFSNRQWRDENVIYNLAIGYPF